MILSEADVQGRVIHIAATHGIRLYRNNSGVAMNPNGQPVRFGLGNISKKFNEVFKTPDLVGQCPDGFFMGVECKEPGWKFRNTDRERAQLAALNTFNADGGLGVFIHDPDTFIPIYQLFKSGRLDHEFSFRIPQFIYKL